MRITDAMIKALKLPEHVAVARDIARPATRPPHRSRWRWSAMLEAGEAKSGGTALLIGSAPVWSTPRRSSPCPDMIARV